MSSFWNTVSLVSNIAAASFAVAASAYYAPVATVALTAYSISKKLAEYYPRLDLVSQAVKMGSTYVANAQLCSGLAAICAYQNVFAPTLTVVSSRVIEYAIGQVIDQITGTSKENYCIGEISKGSSRLLSANLSVRYAATVAEPIVSHFIPQQIAIFNFQQNLASVATSVASSISISALSDWSGFKQSLIDIKNKVKDLIYKPVQDVKTKDIEPQTTQKAPSTPTQGRGKGG